MIVDEVAMQKAIKSSEVISAKKTIFARQGSPEEVRSAKMGHNMLQQNLPHFEKEWSYRHTTSSPHFPQSNGRVAREIQCQGAVNSPICGIKVHVL